SSFADIKSQRLGELRHSWRSAQLVGLNQTSGRESKLVATLHSLAKRIHNRQDDYLRFTVDERAPSTTRGRAPGADGQGPTEGIGVLTVSSRSPSGSARCAPKRRPRPSTASPCSTLWSIWPRASAGCPKPSEPSPRHLNSYAPRNSRRSGQLYTIRSYRKSTPIQVFRLAHRARIRQNTIPAVHRGNVMPRNKALPPLSPRACPQQPRSRITDCLPSTHMGRVG